MANRYYQPPIARPTPEEREICDLLSPQEKLAALLVGGMIKLRTLQEDQQEVTRLQWNSLEQAYTAPISEDATMYVDGDVFAECLRDALQEAYGERAKDMSNISDQEYYAQQKRLLDVSAWDADMDGVTIRKQEE